MEVYCRILSTSKKITVLESSKSISLLRVKNNKPLQIYKDRKIKRGSDKEKFV